MRKCVDLVFITISSPLKIGIYENKILIQTVTSDEKSSDVLPKIFSELDKKYEIKALIYANGPGSFMAIKIAYIFLRTLSILRNIPLYGADAFYFNENQPIKAIGKLFFVKISSEIVTQKLETAPEASFELPSVLDYSKLNTTATPFYGIGAVG
ncbi:MAG: tRNA threonylcarbamoyladenosine biosynthesis protein TsaB [Campylobacterota bacterium]|nr:tRNA threonylcarbamoyladenosine biosynthesis protein TsaB [Campylobacterota bacterium]